MTIYDNILEHLSKEAEWSRQDEEVRRYSMCQRTQLISLQTILEPYTFTTSNPGKEIRGKLIDAFNVWLNVPADKLQVIAKIVNMLHAASLMYGRLSILEALTYAITAIGSTILKMTPSFEEETQVRVFYLTISHPLTQE